MRGFSHRSEMIAAPSSAKDLENGGIEPGEMPPMSAWCPGRAIPIAIMEYPSRSCCCAVLSSCLIVPPASSGAAAVACHGTNVPGHDGLAQHDGKAVRVA